MPARSFGCHRALPDRRVELYFKCCEALLDTWERNKDIKSSGLIGGLSWQVKLELLAGLAYWMHSETERLAAAEDDIIHQLRDALKADRLAEPETEENEARQFVETIRDRSGLLRGRGDGSLEFSHRTFQEYLAARHLAAMDEEDMIDAVMPHLHEAWWQEVHLLLFGHLGTGKEGSRKIERLTFCILDASPKPLPFLIPPRRSIFRLLYPGYWFPGWQLQRRISQLLGRDLAFAIRGYGDCAPTAKTSGLTERLQHELQQVLSRWRRDPDATSRATRNFKEAFETGSRFGPLAAALDTGLLAALKDSDFEVRMAATQALGPAGAGNPAVVDSLLAALKDSDANVRWFAARALGPAGAGNPAVVDSLLAALKDSDANVRWFAAEALGSAARGGEVSSLQLSRYLRRAFSTIYTFPPGVGAAVTALGQLTAGRQLPGYRWRSLKARRLRRERWKKLAIGTGIAAAIAAVLIFGGMWYAKLPEGDPKKAFLIAVPAVSGLFALLWKLWQVIRGGKKTPWD
jgi:HEAT repeats